MSDPVSVDVRRGAPTDDELAAVVAVLSEGYRQEADDALAVDPPAPSAWMLSARGLRRPLRRELGWGRFG